MFSKAAPPLPKEKLKPPVVESPQDIKQDGVLIGYDLDQKPVYWNPANFPNGHVTGIGASGSGKTQTIKSLIYGLREKYPEIKVVVIDFHGDQQIQGETWHRLHMTSRYGVNPLILNLDPEGGGPDLQAIAVASVLKKALVMGPNQEGLLLDILETCYKQQAITSDPDTWKLDPPTFADVEDEIKRLIEEEGCRDSRKLALKMAATFKYGIFSRPQFPQDSPLVRVDLSKLPPAIQSIAAESIARQLMDRHRLMGEMDGKIPRTYLVIDEAKEMPRVQNSASDRISADGRKYGLAAIWFSQSERHLSKEVIGNSSTKFVLPVDSTEVKKVANKFRFAETLVAGLHPLVALCRFGKEARVVNILPYYERVDLGF